MYGLWMTFLSLSRHLYKCELCMHLYVNWNWNSLPGASIRKENETQKWVRIDFLFLSRSLRGVWYCFVHPIHYYKQQCNVFRCLISMKMTWKSFFLQRQINQIDSSNTNETWRKMYFLCLVMNEPAYNLFLGNGKSRGKYMCHSVSIKKPTTKLVDFLSGEIGFRFMQIIRNVYIHIASRIDRFYSLIGLNVVQSSQWPDAAIRALFMCFGGMWIRQKANNFYPSATRHFLWFVFLFAKFAFALNAAINATLACAFVYNVIICNWKFPMKNFSNRRNSR